MRLNNVFTILLNKFPEYCYFFSKFPSFSSFPRVSSKNTNFLGFPDLYEPYYFFTCVSCNISIYFHLTAKKILLAKTNKI